ncbi:glycosyltransferase family 2 protein [Enterococcus faecium]|nr:glycosyltransferase family 2 protein [Enterococcus faecium]
MYKVSVIITTHNRLEMLKKAIKSVKMQSYSNIELVIVNDNSSDGTKEYLDKIIGENIVIKLCIVVNLKEEIMQEMLELKIVVVN